MKIGDKLYCKNNYRINSVSWKMEVCDHIYDHKLFTKNKIYVVMNIFTESNRLFVLDNFFTSKSFDTSGFGDYFWTEQEYRKMKLRKLEDNF